jgi:hypothetical protein
MMHQRGLGSFVDISRSKMKLFVQIFQAEIAGGIDFYIHTEEPDIRFPVFQKPIHDGDDMVDIVELANKENNHSG